MSTPPSYAITGIKEGLGPAPGQVPLRVEVDDFFTKDEYSIQLNLFYLAMVKFQTIPYGDTLSYFQVAGIHGLPHVPWDAWPAGGYHPQYCVHGTILFGTWHRPYMLLFEVPICIPQCCL
jgi:tyrosinase